MILCDLPREVGWAPRFVSAVRPKLRASVLLVAISADAAEGARRRAQAAGFHSFWVKPLTLDDLVEAVGAIAIERAGDAAG